MLWVLLFFGYCPHGMVNTGQVCIDERPWPNYEGVGPLIAISALPTATDMLTGVVMDAEALCTSRGKRVCTYDEWMSGCQGTERRWCNVDQPWRRPDWMKVALRDSIHLLDLDQSAAAEEYPYCISDSGAKMMIGNVQEWVKWRGSYALVGGYWSDRNSSCSHVVDGHAPRWFGYMTGTRCCK